MPRLDPLALCLAFAGLPLRLALAATTDLSPDEAYYLSAARLRLSITDHPPGTVSLLFLADHLPSAWPLELRARTPWILIGMLCSVLLVELVRSTTASVASQRWAALLGTWLLLPMAGGFLATPDAPLFLAAVLLVRSELCDRDSLAIPVAAAACLLGTLFKLTMAPIALAIALASPRSWKRRAIMLAAVGIAMPWALPSLRFQLQHAFVSPSWSAQGAAVALAAALAGQLLLWMPLLPGLARPYRPALLGSSFAASVTLFALFIASAALRAVPPEPNWIAPACIACIAAAAIALPRGAAATRIGAVLIGPALSVVLASHVLHPWLPIERDKDPAARLHGWSQGNPPNDAPGIGPYGVAAERCVYRGDCGQIQSKISAVTR